MIRRCLAAGLILVGAISGSEHVDAAEHTIGPSFDCAKLQTPLAQMICSSSELSKVDLEMVQTFNALRQQVGNSGWAALLQEAVDLQKLVLKKCNIPTAGMPPPGHGDQAICLSDEYGKIRGCAAKAATFGFTAFIVLPSEDIRLVAWQILLELLQFSSRLSLLSFQFLHFSRKRDGSASRHS